MTRRAWLVIGFTLLCIVAALLIPPVPQPHSYHDFADKRALFGIANFFDVVSNGGFLLAGLAGLVVVASPKTVFENRVERWPYAIFFVGLMLTAAGSAYYHLAPDNERLFWDRLPMTIAFMSLIAAQIVDRISLRAGMILLGPMLLVGAASVVYWIATERAGAGNLVPYGILQAYSVVMVLVIAVLYPSRYTRGADVYWVFGAYVLAKVFETFDKQILALGNIVSGHSLKHVAAAIAGLIVMRMLMLRTVERSRAGAGVGAAVRGAPSGA
jgi:hypothetical protein